MGVMNQLRENTGVILWILVISFGVIWVLQDAGTFDVVGNLSNNVANINGDVVTVKQFQQSLQGRLDAYQRKNGDAPPPQLRDQIEDQVFKQIVDDHLREQEAKRLGISVSDNELVDMVLGDNPHQLIKLYFSDGKGGVDRALLQNFLDNPDANASWIQLEKVLRAQRQQEKLENLVTATVRVSDRDVDEEYQHRNIRADTRFVALRYAALPDDSVKVSDRDLKNYYDDHHEDYARKKSYTLDYVSLSKDPTPEDTAAVLKDISSMRDAFLASDNDSLFLARNASEKPYTDAFFRRDELDQPIADAVFNSPKAGTLVGPIISGKAVHLVKILEVKKADKPAVHARHILFRAGKGDKSARAEARKKALEVRTLIRKGADFAEMASQYGSDGSRSRGGDLGWFGPGRMVKPFEDAVFKARVGHLIGPIETDFGYHLIEVTGRADRAVRIADLALGIRTSVATLNSLQEKLDDVQYYATDKGNFKAEAKRAGLELHTVQTEAEQQFIPDLGNSLKLQTFLDKSKAGAISDVIELNDKFIVVSLAAITPAGYRSFDDVRNQIEPRVNNEKKAAIQHARLENALTDVGFDGLASALPGAIVQTAANLSFSSATVPGLGREPKFVGTALGLDKGETSKVIDGNNAVFVLQVSNVKKPAPLPDADRAQLLATLLKQRQNQVRNEWLTALRDRSDITDNRRAIFQ